MLKVMMVIFSIDSQYWSIKATFLAMFHLTWPMDLTESNICSLTSHEWGTCILGVMVNGVLVQYGTERVRYSGTR